jgi:hypothetical protein
MSDNRRLTAPADKSSPHHTHRTAHSTSSPTPQIKALHLLNVKERILFFKLRTRKLRSGASPSACTVKTAPSSAHRDGRTISYEPTWSNGPDIRSRE